MDLGSLKPLITIVHIILITLLYIHYTLTNIGMQCTSTQCTVHYVNDKSTVPFLRPFTQHLHYKLRNIFPQQNRFPTRTFLWGGDSFAHLYSKIPAPKKCGHSVLAPHQVVWFANMEFCQQELQLLAHCTNTVPFKVHNLCLWAWLIIRAGHTTNFSFRDKRQRDNISSRKRTRDNIRKINKNATTFLASRHCRVVAKIVASAQHSS